MKLKHTVAIDKGPLMSGHKVRGIGVHTRELLDALGLRTKKVKELEIEAVNFGKTDLAKYDLLHFPYFHPFFLTIPPNISNNFVVTIHDLIPLIYPKHYPPGLKGKIRFARQKKRLKNADGIITISQTSKKDIVRFLGIPEKKIHVTYLAPRKIFRKLPQNSSKLRSVKEKYNLPKKFVLYVGDVNYNKNVLGLVKACKIAKLPLVISGRQAKEIEDFSFDLTSLEGPRDWVRYLFGSPHPEQAHYQELLEQFDANHVIRLGYASDEDLVAVYNLASVYCQPSFYEGFGLPVLEAFACGCPVVAAKTQALVEIAEGGALFADPKNPKKLAEKLKRLVKNTTMRAKMIREGQKIVRNFTWEKTARETLKVYKKVIKG